MSNIMQPFCLFSSPTDRKIASFTVPGHSFVSKKKNHSFKFFKYTSVALRSNVALTLVIN